MTEILVVVDHADGAVKKPTYEMLTLAARLGEPSAVFIGPAEQGRRGRRGGQEVRRRARSTSSTTRRSRATSWRPRPRRCSSWSRRPRPGAVLIASSAEGKEIAGRLAIKTGSGLITDAVDVEAGTAGPGDHAVGVRRQLHGQGQGHHRAPRSSP